jgi:hypothetical protein
MRARKSCRACRFSVSSGNSGANDGGVAIARAALLVKDIVEPNRADWNDEVAVRDQITMVLRRLMGAGGLNDLRQMLTESRQLQVSMVEQLWRLEATDKSAACSEHPLPGPAPHEWTGD